MAVEKVVQGVILREMVRLREGLAMLESKGEGLRSELPGREGKWRLSEGCAEREGGEG